jgi:hypothetical protein
MSIPIKPFDNTDSAIAAQHPSIHVRARLDDLPRAAASDSAIRKQVKQASKHVLNTMSRVSWCPNRTNKLDAMDNKSALSPARKPHSRYPTKNTKPNEQ